MMGRFNSMNALNPKLKHFAHPHELELVNLNNLQNPNPIPNICSACKLQESCQMYMCRPCNFALHLSCAEFPELIAHPCHPDHPLTLLPSASYPGGHFNCDACNRCGDGFNYHCGPCEFDLHVFCASKPMKITHHLHKCPLELTFGNPYEDAKGFSCDMCGKIGIKQWLYRCGSCEFDVHLDCSSTGSPPKPVVFQPRPVGNHRSFPGSGSSSHTQIQLAYQHTFPGSTSHSQFQPIPGGIPYNQFLQTPATSLRGGGYAMPNRHVEGATQQVGQTGMGSILGRGTDDNGNA